MQYLDAVIFRKYCLLNVSIFLIEKLDNNKADNTRILERD